MATSTTRSAPWTATASQTQASPIIVQSAHAAARVTPQSDGRPFTTAIIPARGGSKGIPLKNLQKVGGRSLLARAIDAARAAQRIDQVVVSTDHEDIAAEARAAGALHVHRPAELAGDRATSESALLHALDSLDARCDITVFMQCTSPFIDPASLDNAIARVADDQADVVFSAVEDHSFLWKLGPDSHAQAVGHDASFRPRRQDRDRHFNETGAFYVMRTSGLVETGHRFFGRLEIEEVAQEQAREIDSMSDLSLVRALAAGQEDGRSLDVDALVTDFDGVHTDDAAFVAEDGIEWVRVHRGDGMGVGRLVAAGFPFLILSKERSPVVTRRAEKLRAEVRQGVDDKAAALREWMAAHGLDPQRVAYVGNDVNDLAAFEMVGWPIAVANAHPRVLAAARSVLTRDGGSGAVREVCDLIPDAALASTDSSRARVSAGESTTRTADTPTGRETAGAPGAEESVPTRRAARMRMTAQQQAAAEADLLSVPSRLATSA